MIDEDEKILEATIVKVEGRPNLPEQPEERTRWECFKSWLFPHMRKSKELAQAYTEAKVAKEENEALKIAEEAAEIAARKDLTKQQEASEFNKLIDDIFADDGLLPGVKALKMAKLMEKNPKIATQLDKVKDIIEKLALKKGLNIEVEDGSLKFLPHGKSLTAVETKVLRFILDGKSTKEIAYVLHRSVRTIEQHRSRIMHKLNVNNIVDLVKRAAVMGLFELPPNG